MMSGSFQGYFSIIPARVRNDQELSANAKLLFGEISSLAQAEGYCYATNEHFAKAIGASERTVRRLLNELADRGHIIRETVRSEASGQVLGRRIFPWWNPPAMPEDDEQETLIPDDSPTGNGPLSGQNNTALNGGNSDTQRDKKCHVSPQDKNGHWPEDKNDRTPGQKWPLANNVEYKINNKIPPIVPQKNKAKRGTEDEARKELAAWAKERPNITAQARSDLIEALMAFCDMRCEKKKPLRSGRSVTLLQNRLVHFGGNNAAAMIAILDEAVLHQWDSVYPLKDGQYSNGSPSVPANSGGSKWI